MRIDRIAVGDIVKASVKGRTVYGEVEEVTNGVVHFRPLSPAVGWRHATAPSDHRSLAKERTPDRERFRRRAAPPALSRAALAR